jgi:hypothetical protein
MKLFVSYSSKDDTSVKSLITDLEATRHAVWVDQELTGGDSWWREILQQVRQCDVFVLALSNNSLRSKPCLAELDYVMRLGIPVVPVQIGAVDSPRLAPVSQTQIINYQDRSATAGIALIAALNDAATRRGALPDPLPQAPPIPYEYLMRLAATIDSPALRHNDQLAIVAQLRDSLQIEEDEGVRRDVVALLQRLRARSDVVTYRAAGEIDAVLHQFGPDARYQDTDERHRPAPPPPTATPPTASPMVGTAGGPQQATHVQPAPQQPVFGQPPHAAGIPSQQLAGQYQPPGGAAAVQPRVQQGALAVWGMVLGAFGLLIPFVGMAGIVCAGMAKSRKQPRADLALAISIIATVVGFLFWVAASGI